MPDGELGPIRPYLEVRFGRHARNRMRRRGWTEREVEQVVEAGSVHDHDAAGNPRYLGLIGDDRVRVVVALDDTDFVITVHRRRT
jgi:Domain of unknown function (DUF4258)